MPRIILVVAVLSLMVYCAVDAVQTDANRVRGLPKAVWMLVIVLLPLVGGLAWLIAGRPRPLRQPPSGRPPQPRGPDDDPDFLRGL